MLKPILFASFYPLSGLVFGGRVSFLNNTMQIVFVDICKYEHSFTGSSNGSRHTHENSPLAARSHQIVQVHWSAWLYTSSGPNPGAESACACVIVISSQVLEAFNTKNVFVCLLQGVQEIANSYVDQQQEKKGRGDEKAREERRLEQC